MTSFKNLDDMNDSGEKDGARSDIYANMQLKTTEELQAIWEDNDRLEWTDDAFDIVRKILIQRTGQVPLQDNGPIFFKPDFFTPSDSQEDSNGVDWQGVDWTKVYADIHSRVDRSGTRKISVAIFGLVLTLACWLVFLPFDIPQSYFLPMLVGGISGTLLIWGIMESRVRLIVLAALIASKYTGGRFDEVFNLSLHVRAGDAFYVDQTGKLQPAAGWEGIRIVQVPQDLYDSCEEKDLLRLVCRSDGKALGNLEQMVKLPEIAVTKTGG